MNYNCNYKIFICWKAVIMHYVHILETMSKLKKNNKINTSSVGVFIDKSVNKILPMQPSPINETEFSCLLGLSVQPQSEHAGGSNCCKMWCLSLRILWNSLSSMSETRLFIKSGEQNPRQTPRRTKPATCHTVVLVTNVSETDNVCNKIHNNQSRTHILFNMITCQANDNQLCNQNKDYSR